MKLLSIIAFLGSTTLNGQAYAEPLPLLTSDQFDAVGSQYNKCINQINFGLSETQQAFCSGLKNGILYCRYYGCGPYFANEGGGNFGYASSQDYNLAWVQAYVAGAGIDSLTTEQQNALAAITDGRGTLSDQTILQEFAPQIPGYQSLPPLVYQPFEFQFNSPAEQ